MEWKLVPVEPTAEMNTRGGEALAPWVAPSMHPDEAYHAMIAAAPIAVEDESLVEKVASAIKADMGAQLNAVPMSAPGSWAAKGGVIDVGHIARAVLIALTP